MKLDLTDPLVYLITAGEASDRNFESDRASIVSIVKLAIDIRVPFVQIREKNLSTRNLFSISRAIASMTQGTATRLLVNDRADIAKAAGADGVHLASASLPALVIRRTFGPDFLIGASTHNAEEISAARKAVDFVVYGPVFETPEKSDVMGLENLRAVCEKNSGFPVFGLGGINSQNFHHVLEAGAAGIAAIRALNDADSLAKIVEEIRR